MSETRYAPDGTWAMPVETGPCRTWPIDPTCSCFEDQDLSDGPPWPREMERAVEIATEYLWRQTAGRYGLCWEMIRPCPAPGPEVAPRGGLAWPDPHGTAPTPSRWGAAGGIGPFGGHGPGVRGTPYGDDGWYGLCGCGGSCGCGPREMQLPGPVWQDLSRDYPHGRQYTLDVFVDGERVEDHWFRVLDNGYIVPVSWMWPRYQDLSRPAIPEPGYGPLNLVGTWGIRYWRGLPVPAAGINAVTTLACEIWKACSGWGADCKLPQGVQSVQREGIQYTLVDPNQDLLVNMPDISAWVASVNPNNLKEQAYVISPDLPRYHGESRRSRLWNPPGRGWR